MNIRLYNARILTMEEDKEILRGKSGYRMKRFCMWEAVRIPMKSAMNCRISAFCGTGKRTVGEIF